MTCHALERLHSRFGLTESTFYDVDTAARQCHTQTKTELLRCAADGVEWHRLEVREIVMIALFVRAQCKIITFLTSDARASRPKKKRRVGRQLEAKLTGRRAGRSCRKRLLELVTSDDSDDDDDRDYGTEDSQ